MAAKRMVRSGMIFLHNPFYKAIHKTLTTWHGNDFNWKTIASHIKLDRKTFNVNYKPSDIQVYLLLNGEILNCSTASTN